MKEPVDIGGALLQLREAKLQIARAVLAQGRGDRLALQTHLRLAQMAANAAEVDLQAAAAPSTPATRGAFFE